MKKIYLSILSIALVSGLSAQVKQQNGPVARSNDHTVAKTKVINNTIQEKSVPIWSNTFANPADWVIAHDATACSLDWQIGLVSCAGSFPTADIASTTAADGWAMVDSDFYGGAAGGTEVEDSWLTMASPVDLTGFPSVVVEFETNYRRYNSERPYIVVGIGDGSGPASVVWPDLDPLTDISAMPNVFDAFPGFANSEATANPQVIQVNISSALVGLTAAQQTDIYIRFHWTGTWGYAWFVDDVNIIEQPADDIQTTSAWISGVNNGGKEYGKNPIGQIDSDWYVGAQVYNFGINDQTNIVMTADFVSFSSMGNAALLESDSTVIIENTETPALSVNTYTGTYTSVSDAEIGGATFGNNVSTRVFEVTANTGEYAIDGLDVYPPADLDLTSMGTASFTGGEDGLVIASLYEIKQPTYVNGIRAMLVTTGSNPTVAGGEVYGSIKDTATWWANDMTSLFNTDPGTVTATDIANGYIDVMFPAPVVLTPGAYYGAVELYSNGNVNDIRIFDDRTVDQPFDASAIYIPGDQSYTNGTASAVRLLMGGLVGLEENTLTGVSVYPNPSEGIINVTNENGTSNTIEVRNMLGQEILTKVANSTTTVDLSANGAGVYLVKVSNENGSLVERVVIK